MANILVRPKFFHAAARTLSRRLGCQPTSLQSSLRMAKPKKPPVPRAAYPKLPAASASTTAAAPQPHATRETIESIVIAFVLAFLFRTFEAEAFVIPTGSMAPTLMGRHKDVDCPKCNYRYQVSASEEESDDPRARRVDCVAGMCPMCRYVLPMRPDLPENVPESKDRENIDYQRSYNGDRILVNKYVYAFSDPRRWDVVVFKFPGNAQINYIKRLVGLPGETLRVFQGDLFVSSQDAPGDTDFAIERKPADKILSMRQLVHDTNHDPADLFSAGFPLRWQSLATDSAATWKSETAIEGNIVRQRHAVDAGEGSDTWLAYQNIVPDFHTWSRLAELTAQASADKPPEFSPADRDLWRPQLVMDANPYNARQDRDRASGSASLEIERQRLGLHWVGDLIVEADVEVEAARGQLLLELVEGGKRFRSTIDLTTGQATLSADGAADFKPTAPTPLNGPGKYRVSFANVDDQLLLWIDGDLVTFAGGTAYDADQVFGARRDILPHTGDGDPGDLAPARIGARNAKLSVDRLRVWRDIYYIAASSEKLFRGGAVTDFGPLFDRHWLLAAEPSQWHRFREREHVEFRLGDDQYFVMGDNSAESSDARLWYSRDRSGGMPGGAYLERDLLIGKALCVYWPHSWNQIPGSPIPFPLFPNVMDMRLVR